MQQPLKIKVFMDASPSGIEEQTNAWIASVSPITIIKTETVVTTLAGKPSEGHPCIVVTIWYEPPLPDRERPGFRAG